MALPFRGLGLHPRSAFCLTLPCLSFPFVSAYSLAEVEQKTLEFRKEMTTPIPIAEDASEFEKFRARAYETAMKVPVKSIELYLDLRGGIEDHVLGMEKLLPDLDPQERRVFTLVLDLNETLVYSDWEPETGLKTFKRPGVDAFLQRMSTLYEVVVYSDQLQKDVEDVVKRIDQTGRIHKLSRPATKYRKGIHFRDLSRLNRNPARVLYISAHALESFLQPENCLDIKPWKLETNDTELRDLSPFLESLDVVRPADLHEVVASYQGKDVVKEFYERCKQVQRAIEEQKQQQQKKRESKWWRIFP
ncbi:hypothetical protein CFC21_094590 [Triticum aestivum]|uniref:Mitochondrial import inner membrane translocase subunit TIM50 n=2 Tax=Triticum aestivum TaxID=4565 RepID=A0A9R1LNF2_WHEAT|nr:hypothetical protein CFC21_094590 [Triticum aestivum]